MTGSSGGVVSRQGAGTGAPQALTLSSTDVATLGQGAVSFVLTVTDRAGNTSAVDSEGPVQTVLNIVIDAESAVHGLEQLLGISPGIRPRCIHRPGSDLNVVR